MAYLTYQEYINFGFAEIDEEEFNRLLPKASDVIDGITRSFYRFNDMEKDVSWRREQFKKAIAAQIEYFHEMGATNTHGLNEPTSVTIGRTTINTRNNAQKDIRNDLVCPDVFLYLKDTGLLYSGVRVV